MDEKVQLPDKLLSRISSAIDRINGHDHFRIISHYDADGISSAGVICNMLARKGKRFHATLVKSLDEDIIRRSASGGDCLILSDMGTSYLSVLEKLSCPSIVLDHHAPTGDSEEVIHVNPHLAGIDGMTGSSGSSLCMLLASRMSESNWDILPIAFAGIVGDRQHVRGLSGLNQYLFQEGVSRKILEVRPGGLVPYGPVKDRLFHSISPFIVGISGDAKGADALLIEANISNDAKGEELNDNGRRKLASLIALRLLGQGTPAATIEELARDGFYFPAIGMTAGHLSSLLNACGRLDKESIGLALTMGDKSALEEASRLQNEYLKEVVEALNRLYRAGLEQMKNIQYFHNDSPSLAGVICGTSMQYFADQSKPTFALSHSAGKIKISSRATFDILAMGVDLSIALRESAAAVGGTGGGHAIASGATIPENKESIFLQSLDDAIGAQKLNKASAR